MKKRLLSALLALALVFVLLPTTALAETPTQNADIYIAGTGWNFEKDGSTYQTVYYQIQSSKGVFLKEFGKEFGKVWTTNPYLEITRVGNDVTITVHGDMQISSNDSCIESAKSYSGDINLIITGTRNDTLTLTNSSIGDAIYSHNGDVTIKGGITVNAYSTCTNPGINNARGIYVHNHNLTISGANTKVNVESMAAYSTVKVDGGNITISDGATLTAKNTSGDKAISFDSITADGYDFMGRSGNSDSYTTLTGGDKATRLQEYSSIQITPTPTPTTYTVTITGENISKYYSSEGELEQTVTAGEAIKTVTVAANGGYYFPDNYVKDLELPSGITATVSGDNWYLTIKGIPSKDATINLPVLSKRPTITVDIPLPVAGNKPATIDQIHLTCDDPNYTPEITGIRWNKGSLTEESVAIGANDTFVAGTCYNVKIFLSSGIADGAYKLAYAGGGDNPWYAYWGTSNFQLYFQATPAATHTHEKGDLQFNSEGHWYKCAADTSCTERIDFASHTYKDNICTVCNYVKPACSHTNLKYIDNNDYETHKVQCADCEEIIAEKEAHDIQGYVIDDVAGTHQEFCNKCHYRGLALHHSIIYVPKDNGHCKACAICKVQLGRVEEHTFENGVCTVCNATSGEIEPPTPDNPGTIVIIRPAEEEKPAQQPNPSTGANDLVGLAVAAAVAAALGSAALLRKHD